MRSVPIVFMDKSFWGGLLEWIQTTMLKNGKISEKDIDMYTVVDTADEAMEYILSKLSSNTPNF